MDVLNYNQSSFGSVDTFTVETGTIYQDSVITSNPSYLLLGSYVDPVFGSYKAGFYSQVRLSSFSPNFGDDNLIEIDSFVLSMNYSSIYGVLDDQKFGVYRLQEDLLSNTNYYSNSNISINSQNLITSGNEIKPSGYYFVDPNLDTIRDNIRLHLDTQLAKEIMDKSKTDPNSFSSVDAFSSYFKGLYVCSENSGQNVGKGAILSISQTPILTIYYRVGAESKKYYFELNSNGVRFNKVNVDATSYIVDDYLKGTDLSNKYMFSQSNSIRARISLPTLSNLSSNSIVHSASLILPIEMDQAYNPSKVISVSIPVSSSDNTLRVIGYAELDSVSGLYSVDLRDHLQRVISGKRLNLGVYFSPLNFTNSAERIIFKGSGFSMDDKPKLQIKYSSF